MSNTQNQLILYNSSSSLIIHPRVLQWLSAVPETLHLLREHGLCFPNTTMEDNVDMNSETTGNNDDGTMMIISPFTRTISGNNQIRTLDFDMITQTRPMRYSSHTQGRLRYHLQNFRSGRAIRYNSYIPRRMQTRTTYESFGIISTTTSFPTISDPIQGNQDYKGGEPPTVGTATAAVPRFTVGTALCVQPRVFGSVPDQQPGPVSKNYNPRTMNWRDCFEMFNANKLSFIQFTVDDGVEYARGEGSTRYVYHQIAYSLLQCNVLKQVSEHYVDIDNLPHDMIFAFASFMQYARQSKAYLPFHLCPSLLQAISGTPMTNTELYQLFDKAYPDTAKYTELEWIEYVGVNKETYIRALLLPPVSDTKYQVYLEIANSLHQFLTITDYTVTQLDEMYSTAGYLVTADTVLHICNLNETQYAEIWQEFVYQLSTQELRQMLIMFTNSVSLTEPIALSFQAGMEEDIRIYTCMKSVTINELLLQDPQKLSGLQSYFQDTDIISDGRYNDNNQETISDNTSDSEEDDDDTSSDDDDDELNTYDLLLSRHQLNAMVSCTEDNTLLSRQ